MVTGSEEMPGKASHEQTTYKRSITKLQNHGRKRFSFSRSFQRQL